MLAAFASVAVRGALRFCGRLSGRQSASFARLRVKAAEVRTAFIGRPVGKGKGNVAALEHVSLAFQGPIQVEATSRFKSPSPKPPPRSQGGCFEPSFDLRLSMPRLMDTDAEYKALSELARQLDGAPALQRVGVVYLFSELQPCASCEHVIAQFEERFPMVSVVVEFDHRYP